LKINFFFNFSAIQKAPPGFGYDGRQSYMVFSFLHSGDHLEIRLRFIARKLNATNSLLLYAGQDDAAKWKAPRSDFLSLSLHKGSLVYQINLGHGQFLRLAKFAL